MSVGSALCSCSVPGNRHRWRCHWPFIDLCVFDIDFSTFSSITDPNVGLPWHVTHQQRLADTGLSGLFISAGKERTCPPKLRSEQADTSRYRTFICVSHLLPQPSTCPPWFGTDCDADTLSTSHCAAASVGEGTCSSQGVGASGNLQKLCVSVALIWGWWWGGVMCQTRLKSTGLLGLFPVVSDRIPAPCRRECIVFLSTNNFINMSIVHLN